ncbi:MAG: endonuclease III [Clostridia bacterium]|nr:endonuclease III [Clostridia bacterium]
MGKLTKEQQRAYRAAELFALEYPDAKCSLDSRSPLQLLVATRLSAQCTDARVNLVTPALFARFPDAAAFAAADVQEVEALIKSCGLYKTKAKDLVALGKMLMEQYEGIVPDTIEELTKLPGIGRKTANLICGDVYGKPAVVADTHFIRLCNRMGFVKTKDPYKVEIEMRKLLPPEGSNDFCHRAVLHGRAVCTARRANCDACCLREVCKQNI